MTKDRKIPITFTIALPIVILGIILSFLGRYPVIGSALSQGYIELTTMNRTFTLKPPELPSNIAFREVFLNLTSSNTMKISLAYGKQVKTIDLEEGVTNVIKLDKAINVELGLISGSGGIHFAYSVKYEEYPYVWLSLPAFFLALLGLALIVRGFIELFTYRT